MNTLSLPYLCAKRFPSHSITSNQGLFVSFNSRGRSIPSALPEDLWVCGSGLNFSSGFVWFLMIPLAVQSRAECLDDLELHPGIPSGVIPKGSCCLGFKSGGDQALCAPPLLHSHGNNYILGAGETGMIFHLVH